MQLAPPRYLDITDAAGAVISIPMPVLAQIEECIRLDAPEAGVVPDALSQHKRIIAQLIELTVPGGIKNPESAVREAWLRGLQYHQLLDLHRKMMLWVQGIDFETQEQFEAALEAQKKSTVTAPPSPEPMPSPVSETSPSVSP
jgi:hypothetical protein